MAGTDSLSVERDQRPANPCELLYGIATLVIAVVDDGIGTLVGLSVCIGIIRSVGTKFLFTMS